MAPGTDPMLLQRGDARLAATAVRRSRRSFDERPVGAALLDDLETVCAGFRPHTDCRVLLVREPDVDVFRGIVGSYGKVVGAPHLLVMIADTDVPDAQQHIGYVGEACVLQATSLALDTCWVGGFFSRRKVGRLVELRAEDSVVAVSPVGHAIGGLSRNERLMRQMAPHGRKPIEEIAVGLNGTWPTWAQSAVECARIAPSATNRQPWRFRMEDGCLVVSKTRGEIPSVTKALDCGIAMLQAELGALKAGVTGRWRDLDEVLDVAVFEPDIEGVSS